MDSKEIRGLMEAYAEVYAPQEEIQEAVKGASPHTMQMRKDAAAERRAGIKPLPAKEGEKYAKYKMAQMAYSKRKREMDEDVEQIDEISQKTATRAYAASSTGEFEGQDSPRDVKRTDNLRRQIKRKFGDKAAQHADRAAHAMTFGRNSKFVKMPKKPTNEEFDIFDIVLEFLQAEGYAETLEEAEWMMANVIDEEAIDIILGEAQAARENPEKYEREQEKRTSKREKAMNDPHKGINSPAFAEFMRKQMGR